LAEDQRLWKRVVAAHAMPQEGVLLKWRFIDFNSPITLHF